MSIWSNPEGFGMSVRRFPSVFGFSAFAVLPGRPGKTANGQMNDSSMSVDAVRLSVIFVENRQLLEGLPTHN